MQACIARACAYAPFCDMIWMETSNPSLEQARAAPSTACRPSGHYRAGICMGLLWSTVACLIFGPNLLLQQ
jgi:Isocitrate lyase family